MTISDQLLSINSTKSAIKSAIEGKGVTVGSVPFADYPTKINQLSGSEPVPEWVRPSDWLAMPTVLATEDKVVMLVAVFDDRSNSIAFRFSGNYTVDWGDGSSPENVATNTTASHIYNYSDISASTYCTRGYRQVLVTVTPQSSQSITAVNLAQAHPTVKGTTYTPSQILDIRISAPSVSGTSLIACSGTISHQMLERFEVIALGAITSMANLFFGCTSLQEISYFNVASVTDASNVFSGCRSLAKLPAFVFSSIINATGMFKECSALIRVPAGMITSTAITNMSYMFNSCDTIREIPDLSTSNVTNMSYMYSVCRMITTVPSMDTSKVTTMAFMFDGCVNLLSVPAFDTSKVTLMTCMFKDCLNLLEVPAFNTSSVTGFNQSPSYGFAQNCRSLTKFPAIDTSKMTSCYQMFKDCNNLREVPALNFSAVTDTSNSNVVSTAYNVSKIGIYGLAQSFSVSGCKLSPDALTDLYKGLPTATKTITTSGNWGATTKSVTANGLTAGSNTITQTNTTGVSVGMYVTGTGISSAVNVSFTGTNDRITKTAHGLANGKAVSFPIIATVVGLSISTIYYVVNATANDFQVALTPGGAPIDFLLDGSGTMLYSTVVTSVTTNSYTVDVPASSTGTQTLVFRNDDVGIAMMKGWTVA